MRVVACLCTIQTPAGVVKQTFLNRFIRQDCPHSRHAARRSDVLSIERNGGRRDAGYRVAGLYIRYIPYGSLYTVYILYRDAVTIRYVGEFLLI